MHLKKGILFLLTVSMSMASGAAWAGPYTEAGYHYTSPLFTGWATGYLNYIPAPALNPANDGKYTSDGGVATQFRTPQNALGVANNTIVSLGDLYQSQIDAGVLPGEITLTFDKAITNGTGDDFAVFENGFWSGGKLFAELGYVEVSTDGTHWARFPSVSLTPSPVGAYGTIDPTDVHNLMGKHERYYGTGFDLDDLIDNMLVVDGLVDLSRINYVKVIDIPGSGNFLDSQGNPIYDAWVTWGSGGVDLDAVGVINAVPIPGAVWLLGSGILALIGIRRRARQFC